jgi:hypothetical protein
MALEQFTGLLQNTEELNLSVTGRSSGKKTTRPVWFVLEDGKLYLLPVRGSDTPWYKNIVKNPAITLGVNDRELNAHAKPITYGEKVANVIAKFGAKYGAGNIKKYYAKFDVAVKIEPAWVAQTARDMEIHSRAPLGK